MDTFIYQKKILTPAECKSIIDFFNSNKDLHRSGCVSGYKIDSNIKLSTDINTQFANKDGEFNSEVSKLILNKLTICVDEYKKKYPILNDISNWRVDNNYNLQRYYPTEGYFAPHIENDGSQYTINRVLVWMIYLNSLNFGGGTRFPYFNKTIKAEEGKVVLWPAYWNHLHHGVVDKSKTKYIATGWFLFDDL